MKSSEAKIKRLTLILLIFNIVLILFIIVRVGERTGVRAVSRENPQFSIEVLPRIGAFYPDTLSFKTVVHESVESLCSVYTSEEFVDSIIVSTEGLPGEWTRYDTLVAILDIDPSISGSACLRIGRGVPENRNDFKEKCIEIMGGSRNKVLILKISLDGFKKQFKRLPLGEPICIIFRGGRVSEAVLTELLVIRYEN